MVGDFSCELSGLTEILSLERSFQKIIMTKECYTLISKSSLIKGVTEWVHMEHDLNEAIMQRLYGFLKKARE
jgi:hypothetical protein